MNFDYGVDPNLMIASDHSETKRWPTDGELVGLFDADTIPYLVGYTSTEQEYLSFKRAKSPYDTSIWKAKINHVSHIINSTLSVAGCDAALFYLTDSFKNFRLEVGTLKKYKGQRKLDKPPFFKEIKSWIRSYHSAKLSNLCEADDEISIEAWRRHKIFAKENGVENLFSDMHRKFSGFCILSQDKDLNMIPGLHNSVGKLTNKDNEIWVDRIGWLDPKYKEVEVNAYEYWPLFDGKELDPRDLFTFRPCSLHPVSHFEVVCEDSGWEREYTWYCLDDKAKAQEQDTITRGPRKGEGKYKRVQVGTKIKNNITKLKGAGLLFFYAQIIMGDSVDNYPGIPGSGPKRAYEILEGAKTEYDMYCRVLKAYTQYYINKDKALDMLIEQAQLAWMQTEKFELWQPPTKEKGSYPL